MLKKLTILCMFLLICLMASSCGALQLKWDRIIQEHMATLLTTPDETVSQIIEDWNGQENLKPGESVDLELIQKNITNIEYDNRKGICRVYLKEGLDIDTQRKTVGMTMVVFGQLYWLYPEQKREVVYVYGNIDEDELYVFSWSKGKAKPEMDKDRSMNFV